MAARLTRMLAPALVLVGCSPASDAASGQDAARGQNAARGESAATATETTTDRTVLGGMPTMLVARDGACLLRQDGRPDTPLAPAPPCRFLRADGQVQQHAYPDRRIDAVVLVVGTPADPARKAHFGIAAEMACGTVAHGLIVRGDRVTPARQPQRDGMFCVDQGRDEKDFYAVAHDR